MKQQHYLFPALCSTLLLASPALQANQWDTEMSSWDQDGDNQVSLQEWDSAVEEQGLFDELDENGNGIYDFNESVNGYPEYDLSMDIDDGGYIERQEFTVGWFDRFDENDDRLLDSDEFDQFNSSYDSESTATN